MTLSPKSVIARKLLKQDYTRLMREDIRMKKLRKRFKRKRSWSGNPHNPKSVVAGLALKEELLLKHLQSQGHLGTAVNWKRFRKRFLELVIEQTSTLRCAYCGKDDLVPYATSENNSYIKANTLATIDHVHPLSKGGCKIDLYNLAIACPKCNMSKASMSIEEWKGFEEARRIRTEEVLAVQLVILSGDDLKQYQSWRNTPVVFYNK